MCVSCIYTHIMYIHSEWNGNLEAGKLRIRWSGVARTLHRSWEEQNWETLGGSLGRDDRWSYRIEWPESVEAMNHGTIHDFFRTSHNMTSSFDISEVSFLYALSVVSERWKTCVFQCFSYSYFNVFNSWSSHCKVFLVSIAAAAGYLTQSMGQSAELLTLGENISAAVTVSWWIQNEPMRT